MNSPTLPVGGSKDAMEEIGQERNSPCCKGRGPPLKSPAHGHHSPPLSPSMSPAAAPPEGAPGPRPDTLDLSQPPRGPFRSHLHREHVLAPPVTHAQICFARGLFLPEGIPFAVSPQFHERIGFIYSSMNKFEKHCACTQTRVIFERRFTRWAGCQHLLARKIFVNAFFLIVCF